MTCSNDFYMKSEFIRELRWLWCIYNADNFLKILTTDNPTPVYACGQYMGFPLFCNSCGICSSSSLYSPSGRTSYHQISWSIWYWGSKWNLHTVCWSAVGCEWGTTSVYFGITYVCFIPSRLPFFAVEPQYLLQDFLFLSKVSFEGHIQNLQKISCWFKIWMGFVGPILIKLWTSSIWGFL